jgi:hypothetical protein
MSSLGTVFWNPGIRGRGGGIIVDHSLESIMLTVSGGIVGGTFGLHGVVPGLISTKLRIIFKGQVRFSSFYFYHQSTAFGLLFS